MGFYSFVLSACNGRFDARHAVLAGGSVMMAFCLLVSGGSMKARTVGEGGQYQLANNITSSIMVPVKISLPAERPATRNITVATTDTDSATVSEGIYKLSIFKGNGNQADEDLSVTMSENMANFLSETDAPTDTSSVKDTRRNKGSR